MRNPDRGLPFSPRLRPLRRRPPESERWSFGVRHRRFLPGRSKRKEAQEKRPEQFESSSYRSLKIVGWYFLGSNFHRSESCRPENAIFWYVITVGEIGRAHV